MENRGIHYKFWPYAYSEGYWAHAYDAIFEAIFWPYGSPYSQHAYAAPLVMVERLEATLEAIRIVRPSHEAFYNSLSDEQKVRFNLLRPDVGRAHAGDQAEEGEGSACGEPKPGLIDLPITRIEQVVRPRESQQKALDELREATASAVDILQSECPDVIAQTPVGRLAAMERRIQRWCRSGAHTAGS